MLVGGAVGCQVKLTSRSVNPRGVLAWGSTSSSCDAASLIQDFLLFLLLRRVLCVTLLFLSSYDPFAFIQCYRFPFPMAQMLGTDLGVQQWPRSAPLQPASLWGLALHSCCVLSTAMAFIIFVSSLFFPPSLVFCFFFMFKKKKGGSERRWIKGWSRTLVAVTVSWLQTAEDEAGHRDESGLHCCALPGRTLRASEQLNLRTPC